MGLHGMCLLPSLPSTFIYRLLMHYVIHLSSIHLLIPFILRYITQASIWLYCIDRSYRLYIL